MADRITGPIPIDPATPIGATTPHSDVDTIFQDLKQRTIDMFTVDMFPPADAAAGQLRAGTAKPIDDTQAVILALDPEFHKGRMAWANDAHVLYLAGDYGSGYEWRLVVPRPTVPTPVNLTSPGPTVTVGPSPYDYKDIAGYEIVVTLGADIYFDALISFYFDLSFMGVGLNGSLQCQIMHDIDALGFNKVLGPRPAFAQANWADTMILAGSVLAAAGTTVHTLKLQARTNTGGGVQFTPDLTGISGGVLGANESDISARIFVAP